VNERRTVETPNAIRKNAPEVRTKLTPHLYRALNREAAAEDISVAELLRRIVTRHYEPAREATLEQLRAALAEASAERQLLVTMMDLMYEGLLVRLGQPEAEDLEARIAAATQGHLKWRMELARRLTDGPADALLELIREAGREGEGSDSEVKASRRGKASA
jgi:hypothetical protein